MSKVLCSLESNLLIHYYKNFLSEKNADKLYKLLEQKLEYNSEIDSMVLMHGKYVKIPRKQTAYGAPGTKYNFSGNIVSAKSYDDSDEVSVAIKALITEMNIVLNRKFNFILINRYADGNQYIGPHSDDERDLIQGHAIAGISLGAERDILFESKEYNETPESNKLKLEHGSLFVMYTPTNKYWKHSIPKSKYVFRPRISLTFREMK
jgi:alpha-ketoglutarate-dependent dioxygenase alkB family protein 2